jgi:hypothetical protein
MAEVTALGVALAVEADDLADLRAELRDVVPPGAPGSPTWDALAWADDVHAQRAVVHGEEMATEDIAALTGWSQRSVQRALESGLGKLNKLPLHDIR